MFAKSITRATIAGAILAMSVGACTTPGKRTAIGAGGGAGVGAAIGGATSGWKGAGIGAAAGAAVGAAVGNYLDKQHKELEKVADTKRLKDGILVDLKNDLLFETGSAELKGPAVTQLKEVGGILSKYEKDRIRIAGHTDSVGSDAFNSRLSERRAAAVRSILKAEGVRDDQMLIKGFGETMPVADNSSTKGRTQNRRVELIIDVPADRQPASDEPSATLR